MSAYKYSNTLQQNNHQAFDALHAPGAAAPNAGVYRCEACGDEIGIAKGHTLPPQNHHQHTSGARIQWRLTVAAIQQ